MAGSTGAVTGRHLHFGVYKNGTMEACAIAPAAWSGVPNRVGSHPGDDKLDGGGAAPVPPPEAPGEVPLRVPQVPGEAPQGPPEVPPQGLTLYEYSGIVASPGDARRIEALLQELAIPFVKKEALR